MTAARWREALIGVVYLAVIGALVLVSVMVYNKDFSSFTDVSLRADSVGNALQKGSDVKVRGVVVGSVTGISTRGRDTTVSLRLDPNQARTLPDNVTARLLPKTLFGERYVDLELPKQPSGTPLRNGDVIEQDHSAQSVELEALFGDLLPVLKALQPDKLSAILGELAGGLRARGADLAALVSSLNTYLSGIGPAVPQLTDDLTRFASVARTYTDATPQLLSALSDAVAGTRTIYREQRQFRGLLASVTAMAQTVGSFVGTNQQQIIGVSRNSLPTLDTLARYSSEFPCIARAIKNYIPAADRALGQGTSEPGLHVIMHVVSPVGDNAGRYVPGDQNETTSDAGPRCPYSTATSALQSTALQPSGDNATQSSSSIGSANSPQENELIDELVAPTVGMAPSQFPRWASLLLGPALRGTTVSLR